MRPMKASDNTKIKLSLKSFPLLNPEQIQNKSNVHHPQFNTTPILSWKHAPRKDKV